MSYDSRPDTWAHIHQVRRNLTKVITDLLRRAEGHDLSKLSEPEVSVFDEFTPKLAESTYNSDEYKEFLRLMHKGGLEHHYRKNDHHPEHFVVSATRGLTQGDIPLPYGEPGIHGMNLVQMIEMLCDWKAATTRHLHGDLEKSINENAERFGYGDEIRNLLMYTAAYFGWL